MAIDDENFLEYQLFTKKYQDYYNQKLCSALEKNGYITKYQEKFTFILGKREGDIIIFLPNAGRKISYGNVLQFYDLLPFEGVMLEKDKQEKTESCLEFIAEKLSEPDVVDVAFKNGISLNVYGNVMRFQERDSLYIPLIATKYMTKDLVSEIKRVIKNRDKKSLKERIKNYFSPKKS